MLNIIVDCIQCTTAFHNMQTATVFSLDLLYGLYYIDWILFCVWILEIAANIDSLDREFIWIESPIPCYFCSIYNNYSAFSSMTINAAVLTDCNCFPFLFDILVSQFDDLINIRINIKKCHILCKLNSQRKGMSKDAYSKQRCLSIEWK